MQNVPPGAAEPFLRDPVLMDGSIAETPEKRERRDGVRRRHTPSAPLITPPSSAEGYEKSNKRKANESLTDIFDTLSAAKRKSQLTQLRDLNLYKKIIKTYKSPNWSGCGVTPRDLADYGWEYEKRDLVKCVECEQHLSTSLPPISKVSVNVYNICLKKVHDNMISAHRPTCKHRVRAPPFRIVDPTAKEVLAGIEERLSTASSVAPEELIVDIPKDAPIPVIDKYPPGLVFISTLGWKMSKSRRGLLQINCEFCAREMIFRSSTNFDPVRNHERWCPQVDANDNGEPCWRAELDIVLNAKNKVPLIDIIRYERSSSRPSDTQKLAQLGHSHLNI
ncbi:unnamed protein product [Caenorhabditis auriculariae]|uniref:C3HC-type domain-containing protein n=1 Tax=Caenorhabditis auriculariae TaxID=2777116 RepID=A0A8S1HC16_9PELO|nr:unnamed protein product [Caenorhabditis auriculariae]